MKCFICGSLTPLKECCEQPEEVPGGGFVLVLGENGPDEVFEEKAPGVDYEKFFPSEYIQWEATKDQRKF